MKAVPTASGWHRIGCQGERSAYGNIDWRDAAMLARCDPYLVWLDISSRLRADQESKQAPDRWVAVLADRDPAGPSVATVMSTHFHAADARFVPALVYAGDLADHLAGKTSVRCFELCVPRFSHLTDWTNYWQRFYGPPLAMQRSRSAATRSDRPPLSQRRYDGQTIKQQPRVHVAIIDDGFNFMSADLRNVEGLDLRSVWYQTRDSESIDRLDGADGPSWTRAFAVEGNKPRGGLYGRFLRVDGVAAGQGDEIGVYRRMRYPRKVPRWSHGAVVASQVARMVRDEPGELKKRVSVAFTQLPATTITDTTGASLSCHVIEAIHDALDEAGGNPVVVNLSYGNHAGAHDGSSLFERALHDLLCTHPALHVVLPAGNGHLSRTHAAGRTAPGRASRLRWRVQADNPDDVYLQLWFAEPERVRVELIPPGGGERVAVVRGQATGWIVGSGEAGVVRAAVVFPCAVPQGEQGSMCLVCVGPTRARVESLGDEVYRRLGAPPRRASHAPHGVWTIEIGSLDERGVDFHAWIQRADEAPARWMAEAGHGGRQGYFLDVADTDAGVDAVGPDPRFTLNGIATFTHDRLWVVGAMRQCDAGLSPYSAAGPDAGSGRRWEGPDVVVAADESLALPGRRMPGFLGSSRVRVAGTSLAAAVVTGQLSRHLATGATAGSFCFWPEQGHSERPRAAAGEPERAPTGYRGSEQRWAGAGDAATGQCPDECSD